MVNYKAIENYQSPLKPEFRRLTNGCGFVGSILGIIIGIVLAIGVNILYARLTGSGEAQHAHPYIFGVFVISLLAFMTFFMSFICHLPFVLFGKITTTEAFQAVFRKDHPERWVKVEPN